MLIDGYGEKKFHDGRVYKGYFKKCKYDGQGEFHWPDGRVYFGNYKDGLKHGEGILKLTDFSYEKGYWEYGYLKTIEYIH